MTTRILLLGTDRYVADECVRRGLDTIAVRNVSAARNGMVRLPAAVREIHVNQQDHLEDVLCSLGRAGVALTSIGAVQTSNEFCVVAASALANLTGLAAVPADVAVRMRDKYLQKLAVREAGIPVAEFHYVDGAPTPDDVRGMAFPVVVKPVSGAGTEATVRVDRVEDLAPTVATLSTGRSPSRGHLIEEFVDGDEYVVDGVCQGGEVAFSSLGRYGSPCLETISAAQPVVMRRCHGRSYEAITDSAGDVVRRALAAIGFTDGVFHMELFLNRTGQFVFSECAARRGGAMVEEEVRLKHGFSLAAAAVDVATGVPVRKPADVFPGEVGMTFLHLPPGLVLELPHRKDITNLPGVQFVRYDTHIGARTAGAHDSTDQRAAIALVSGDDLASLERNMERLRAEFIRRSVVAPTSSARAMRDFQTADLGRADLADRVYMG